MASYAELASLEGRTAEVEYIKAVSVGSVFTSIYVAELGNSTVFNSLPGPARSLIKESVAAGVDAGSLFALRYLPARARAVTIVRDALPRRGADGRVGRQD